ncbi:MAG: glycosyltransferase family 4 protein [Ferruginibacter sp.]
MSKHLHIVMHDVPWPADFVGVTDLYYKIKWLHVAGIRIHLHCFVKQRPPQPYLEKYCETVRYYKRKTAAGYSLSLPYIVSSRKSEQLISNLEKDDYPVLLEGIHCTYPLFSGRLKHRKVFLRLHNVEHKYYANLAANESNIFKKLYFRIEARLLKKYEQVIAPMVPVWSVSEADAAYYQKSFSADAHFFPVFLPWETASGKSGKGHYCLYHGNLSVNENEKAAEWLITKVFSGLDIPLIIAGKGPSAKLRKLVGKHECVSIVADPHENVMQDLIEKAQVNVLPSMNSTGVKLKLLNALFNGRHCLVNKPGAEGSGVEELCSIADSAADFRKKTTLLFSENFAETTMQYRSTALKAIYNNEQNARRLIAWIW